MMEPADHRLRLNLAEENLESDRTGRPVRHPQLAAFFASFHAGRHYTESPN